MRHNNQPTHVKNARVNFGSETALCDAFAARARATGWAVYPETGGWDLLLVWTGEAPVPSPACEKADAFLSVSFFSKIREIVEEYDGKLEAGMQLGIQAKLRANVDVLHQAVNGAEAHWAGPDFRGVLVPNTSEAFNAIASHLGLHVYVEDDREKMVYTPDVKWRAKARVWVPPVVPSWSGGGKSPRTLSAWRVGALKICGLLRLRGWVTKAEFKEAGIEHRSWVSREWIKGERVAGGYRYRIGAKALPDAGYEAERDALTRSDST